MKKLAILGLILTALLLITACESGGKFRVVNQTSHSLYLSLGEGDEVTIPGGEEHTFEVATAKQSIFNPDVEKEVPVRIIGETYHIYDEILEVYTDSTTVSIKVGETLSAYILPNRASFKLINNSSQIVENVLLYKHNFVAGVIVGNLGQIDPGDFAFKRVDYATPSNNFYYYAVVQMENGSTLTYGDETNILLKDEQFLITITDPE